MGFLDEGDGDYASYGPSSVAGAFIVVYLAATLGSAGGIGGGGLILPIILVVGGFPFDTAVILCITVVLGNTLSQVIVNMRKTHPLAETRPLIDFQLVSVFLPAQIGGANVGVLFAPALPSAALMILAMVMLLSVSLKVGRKGLSLYKKESEQMMDTEKHGGTDDKIVANINPLALAGEERQRGRSLDLEQNGSARLSKSNLTELEKGGMDRIDRIPRPSRQVSMESVSTVATLMSRTISIVDEAKTGTRIMEFNDHLPVVRVSDVHLGSAAGQPTLTTAVPAKEAVLEAMEEVMDFNLEVVPMRRVKSISTDINDTAGADLNGLVVSPKPPVEWPYKDIARIVGFWVIYATFIIVIKEETVHCSPAFFATLVTSYVPVFVAIGGGMYLVAKYQKRNPSQVLLGDVDFSKFTLGSSRTYLVPSVAFITGILCSLLGIGGGELIGPLFLVLELLPQVGAASTALMSCSNAALNIIHYFFLGTLRYDWFLLCFFIGLCGGVSGRKLSSYITKTYGRPSLMVFALSLTLFMSVCLLSYRLSMAPKADYYVVDPIC